ncbi:MAG: hypothetical protein C0407_13760, partial [Desulfobacca sp.]|nr:hypothetical protein [Desulfobacca sp.]
MDLNLKNPFWICLVSFFLGFPLVTSLWAQSNPAPFFLMGDGRIHIQNVQTKQEAKVDLLLPDGTLNESALDRVDAVFGFSGQKKGEHISPRLLFMLNYFSNQ